MAPSHDVARREDSLHELYRRHADIVAARLYRQCGDGDLARDLTQDAFVVAMRRVEAGEAALNDDTQARAWLHAVAYNLLRDHRRSGQRRRTLLSRWFRSADTQVAPLVGEGPDQVGGMAVTLDVALQALNYEQRDAFVLRVVEGLSLEAAARALDTTIQTVSYRAKKAEAIVRKHFEEGITT
ncbi:MAG: RNA polymerase sigma factor [Nannocystaceae bacterium]|nr:RNA polymerase sigma factor [Nannocystaceae bacterium]